NRSCWPTTAACGCPVRQRRRVSRDGCGSSATSTHKEAEWGGAYGYRLTCRRPIEESRVAGLGCRSGEPSGGVGDCTADVPRERLPATPLRSDHAVGRLPVDAR